MTDIVNLMSPFLNATQNVLQTMASTKAVPGPATGDVHSAPFGVVTGIIGMAGEKMTGNLIVSFDESSIIAIVSRMLTEEFLIINQDVIDAVGEITNMICGGAKRELAEQGLKFDMASPVVLSGENLGVQSTSKSHFIMVPFTTPEGRFMLETDLETKKR